MSARNDGGPAFPVCPPVDSSGAGSAGGYPYPDAGMSRRDYFAAHAPGLPAKIHEQFMAASKRRHETDLLVYARVVAEWRRYYADAMLVELAK